MDKKFVVLMVIFFIVFGVFITYFAKDGLKIANFAKASVETDPSSQTSLIFAWPLTTKVGAKVDINIFVRNVNNSPLDKKPVRVVTSLGTINGVQEATGESDKTGRINFILTSDVAGTADLTAFVNGNQQLSQKISVKFE